MSDVYRVITLGIGPSSDLTGLLTVGLNIPIVFTGKMNTDVRKRSWSLEVDTRLTSKPKKRTFSTDEKKR